MALADARARIEAHRLLRKPAPEGAVLRVESARDEVRAREGVARKALLQRSLVHFAVFFFAYVFTAGLALVAILLWVRPDALLALVLVGLACSSVFVVVFASARVLMLHHVLNLYPNKEEDPGMHYHIGKSVAYGFLALIVAVLLTGLLVNIASALS